MPDGRNETVRSFLPLCAVSVPFAARTSFSAMIFVLMYGSMNCTEYQQHTRT